MYPVSYVPQCLLNGTKRFQYRVDRGEFHFKSAWRFEIPYFRVIKLKVYGAKTFR